MKLSTLFIAIFAFSLFTISCKKDNDVEQCVVLKDTLIGTWKAPTIVGGGTFELKSDGTWIDKAGSLSFGSIASTGVSNKKWTANNNKNITVTGIRKDNQKPLSVTYEARVIDCNTISLTYPGFPSAQIKRQ